MKITVVAIRRRRRLVLMLFCMRFVGIFGTDETNGVNVIEKVAHTVEALSKS